MLLSDGGSSEFMLGQAQALWVALRRKQSGWMFKRGTGPSTNILIFRRDILWQTSI
jgi:hypothetical protein